SSLRGVGERGHVGRQNRTLQGGIRRFAYIVRNVVVSASDKSADNRGSERLLNAIGLGLVNESRYGDGPYILRKLRGMPGRGVVTGRCDQAQLQRRQENQPGTNVCDLG